MTQPFDDYDYSTKAGAQRLADRLNAFWHAKGHTTVAHWIEPVRVIKPTKTEPTQHTTWVVRSNLVRGLPPKEDVNATNEPPIPRSSPTSRTATHNPNTTELSRQRLRGRATTPNRAEQTTPHDMAPPPA